MIAGHLSSATTHCPSTIAGRLLTVTVDQCRPSASIHWTSPLKPSISLAQRLLHKLISPFILPRSPHRRLPSHPIKLEDHQPPSPPTSANTSPACHPIHLSISLPTPVSPCSTQMTLPRRRPSISVVAAQCISSQPRIERALIPIDMQKIWNMSLRWVLYTYVVRLIDLSCPDSSLPSFARIR